MTHVCLADAPRFKRHWRVLGAACCLVMSSVTATFAQDTCDRFLDPPRQVRGKATGPQSCVMQETAIRYQDRSFTRIDVGLNGTVEGYLAKAGDYKEYFSNSP